MSEINPGIVCLISVISLVIFSTVMGCITMKNIKDVNKGEKCCFMFFIFCYPFSVVLTLWGVYTANLGLLLSMSVFFVILFRYFLSLKKKLNNEDFGEISDCFICLNVLQCIGVISCILTRSDAASVTFSHVLAAYSSVCLLEEIICIAFAKGWLTQ